MVKLPLLWLLSICLVFTARAKDKVRQGPQEYVSIKTSLLPGYLYFVKGKVAVVKDSVHFFPSEQCYEWAILNKLYPCHNEIVKPLEFSIPEIDVVRRRNTLLLFPNKFLIKLKNGKKYKFFSYRRGVILRAIKNNPLYAHQQVE
ncbi:hypothetical protein [Arsenicibacter rosenii]|nr:hypothetical protein [Arsenicibacter rosenii]